MSRADMVFETAAKLRPLAQIWLLIGRFLGVNLKPMPDGIDYPRDRKLTRENKEINHTVV